MPPKRKATDVPTSSTAAEKRSAFPNGIYDTALSKNVCWTLSLKHDKASAIRMGYQLNVELKRRVDEKKVIISTILGGRYCLEDVLNLEVKVKSGEDEHFELDKNMKEQVFELDIKDPSNKHDINNLVVALTLRIYPKGYITEWTGTELNFTNPERAHNVVLLVDGKKFYVLKEYLATWSRYFDRLFFGGFAEQNQDEVTIKDVDSNNFYALLQLIHPNRIFRLKDVNVLKILELGDRFEMPSVMSECGKYLQNFDNCKEMELIDRLEIADKLNLASLVLTCLSKAHEMPKSDFDKFREDNRQRIRELSRSTLANLI